jgi:predicted GIY-YIG superfamily endonuclease
MTQEPIEGRMIQRGTGEEVALYRLFDAGGRLLYVGISKDPMNRWAEHRANRWWSQVERYSVTWHPDRPSARAAEKAALATEGAVHNIHSTPGHGAHWLRVTTRAQQIATGKRGTKRPKAEPAAG